MDSHKGIDVKSDEVCLLGSVCWRGQLGISLGRTLLHQNDYVNAGNSKV